MALRQAARRLGALAGSSPQVTRAFAVGSQRATMSTEAQRESVKDFLEKFKQHAPSTMDPPNFPSDFLPPAREVPATPPAKLTLNFYMPHEIEYEGAEVDSIQLPAVTGDMGVLPGHVPTVAQLRPGVVAVNMDDKETKKVRRDVLQITPGFTPPRTRRDPSRLRVSARHPPAPKETLSFLWRHGQIVTFLWNQPTNQPTNRRSPPLSLPSVAFNSISSAAGSRSSTPTPSPTSWRSRPSPSNSWTARL
mmetsp:Transcript_7423/g.30060  ORF Transcript_7423/g.30060 Transcript_7423/m.30060 type:complete len:249 (+) Transcript_7423:73-819(+)